jgi:hypothetical protein
MATTTTNFGWDIPQSTDLVKDGATAIAALGQDIDTALVDLKGGTTGQVLAKASGTDLDFSWVAQDDSNAIQNAIVDAKGDLIGATAADTPARLAVGTNGQVLTADSTAATGLAWTTISTSPTFVGASVTKSAAQTISNNTTTVLSWNGEQFDTNTFHDNSTNNSRMTIPSGKAGKYAVSSVIRWVGNSTGRRKILIYKNGVEALVVESGASVDATSVAAYLVMDLAEADYVEIYANQTSGGNLNVYETALGSYFQIQYLGA